MCFATIDESNPAVWLLYQSTECSEEQQKEDMPELQRLNAEACETQIMWEFFGGFLTLPNGNRYQVMN